jgi:hypothetical protein
MLAFSRLKCGWGAFRNWHALSEPSGLAGGAVIVSPRFAALDEELKSDILWHIRNFDDFKANEEWDPENEHAYLALDYRGCNIVVMIDYWARDMTSYTPDPYDPNQTQLVMTIRFEDEGEVDVR